MKYTGNVMEYLSQKMGKPHGHGPEYSFDCPNCLDSIGTESSKKKFHWNANREVGHCYRCEFKVGSLDYLLKVLNNGNLGIQERILLQRDPPIVRTSASKAVRDIFRGDSSVSDERSLACHPLPLGCVELFTMKARRNPKCRMAMAYLRRRKVPDKTIRAFRIKYCTIGKLEGYLVFPLYQNGELVYWTSRAVAPNPWVKSLNPKKLEGHFNREDVLFNFDACRGLPRVSLVEGPFDCMAASPAIALLGKEISPEQVELILQLVEEGLQELVVVLDPGAGSAIDRIRDELSDAVRVSSVYLTEGDPADRVDEIGDILSTRTTSPTLSDRVRSRLRK